MAKRLMMIGVAAVAAISASAAITSRSYVQGGLVAQYDGINNAGHDAAHNDSATTWADLTGHGNDGTVGANVIWRENGWTNGAAGRPISVGFGLSRVTGTGTFTVQFACKPISHLRLHPSLFHVARHVSFEQALRLGEQRVGFHHNDGGKRPEGRPLLQKP